MHRKLLELEDALNYFVDFIYLRFAILYTTIINNDKDHSKIHYYC